MDIASTVYVPAITECPDLFIGGARVTFTLRTDLLGILCLLLAFLIGLHHLLVAGRWFDVRDVLHHEFFLALMGGLGVGLLVGHRYGH